MHPIDDFIDRSLVVGQEEFTSGLPAGVFLCEPDTPAADPKTVPLSPTRLDGAPHSFPPWARGARTPGNEVFYVLPLVKRPGLPYPDRILVGRTDQNDLTIPHVTVSRSHAYVQLAAELLVIDTGSKHGTFLKDERMVANRPYPVVSGARVRFGKVRTMFLSAVRFFEYCQARIVSDQAQRSIDGAISHKP